MHKRKKQREFACGRSLSEEVERNASIHSTIHLTRFVDSTTERNVLTVMVDTTRLLNKQVRLRLIKEV